MVAMTVQVLANWFNFVGTAIVLMLSLAVVRHHPRPYFGRWLNAYGSGTTLVGLELVASYVGRRPVLDQAEIVCCVTGTWWFMQTGMHLRGKQLPGWLYGLAVLVGLLVANALMLHGLEWLDAECRQRFNTDFAGASDAQRRTVFDLIAWRQKIAPGYERPAQFFARLRGLMMIGFYSLPEGAADIGYMGNKPSLGPYAGPTREALAQFNQAMTGLGLKPAKA